MTLPSERPPRRGAPARSAPLPPRHVDVRRVTTSDKCSIAYRIEGSGPVVLVLFPYHVSHLELGLLVPAHRRGLDFLAHACTVVPLDLRGSGLSTRQCGPLSLDAFSRDLETVRRALGVARVTICAAGAAAVVACAHAAHHGGAVSRLVLIQPGHSEANRLLLTVRRASPVVEARVRAQLLGSGAGEGTVAALAAAARAALDVEQLLAWQALLDRTDVLALARRVTVPVLCVHATDDELVDEEATTAFAAALPRGRFLASPGRSGLQVWEHRPTMVAIRTFLCEGGPVRNARTNSPQRLHLSDREIAVLHLLATGRTNREIATTLRMSVHTVSFHLRNIFRKTGASNRTEAAAYAHQRGLLT